MTKEEKQLLLVDLCVRLPYGVKVNYNGLTDYTLTNTLMVSHFYELMKPYLRPMSNMTEEEKKELLRFGGLHISESGEVIDVSCVGFERHSEVQDWLNAHHFDYRGLIEKGLALPAPEGMYNIK